MTLQLLLASQSPRRRELIQLIGLPFSVTRADVDENSVTDADPAINVVKTAELKAQNIASQIQFPSQTIIVAADTIVILDNQMLGKPKNAAEAHNMLLSLRGQTHEVHTGMVLIDMRNGERVEAVCTAVVTMRPYTEEEIVTYIATGDPLDKAGAYAIQHPMFKPVSHLKGCYLGIVGLSVCQLVEKIRQLNIVPNPHWTALYKAHQAHYCPLFASFILGKQAPDNRRTQ